jgi:hypothetical protein
LRSDWLETTPNGGTYPRPENIGGFNILDDIRDLGDRSVSYLLDFHDSYFAAYNPSQKRRFATAAIARSVDLSFVGPDAVSERAKYMFIFEGSLQDQTNLSMVVGCLFLVARGLLEVR